MIGPRSDPFHCRALLHDGSWSPLASDGSRKWEPNHCRMVEYSGDAIQDCLEGRRIIFAGDSTIRQVFLAAAKRLDPEIPSNMTDFRSSSTMWHQNISYEAHGVKLDFIWDPWLNSTTLVNALGLLGFQSPVETIDPIPVLFVVGAPGLWTARYGGDDYLHSFKRRIDGILSYLTSNFDHTVVQDKADIKIRKIRPQILLAPVPVPNYDSLSYSRSRTILPERIEAMNDYLLELPSKYHLHILWAYNRFSTKPADDLNSDGLHASDNIAANKLDIALNARCNSAARVGSRSFKGTCCVSEPYNFWYKGPLIWWLIFTVLFSEFFRIYFLKDLPPFHRSLMQAANVIIYILIWCWYCDGSLRIGQMERHYREDDFIKACLVWLAVSVWSFRERKTEWDPPAYRGPGFLSRDHSEEIKGLMQGFILLYHYHYASQTLWVYKIIRLFVSAYFYLSGYGHTSSWLKKRDFSLTRVLRDLFRLNLLSLLLPYIMGTHYSLYYFAPVISFWYLILYAMLGFFSHLNKSPWWFGTKVIVTAALTDWLTSTPGILESFAAISLRVLRIPCDPEEMRFRLRLDRYIVYVGAVMAYIIYKASRRRKQTGLDLSRAPLDRRPKLGLLLDLVCVIDLFVYVYLTQHGLIDKRRYNLVHPYISWVPILCFVVLRNSYDAISNRYLALPAALGRISLETYVLQYHIWLGGDATAKLSLGLGDGNL